MSPRAHGSSEGGGSYMPFPLHDWALAVAAGATVSLLNRLATYVAQQACTNESAESAAIEVVDGSSDGSQ